MKQYCTVAWKETKGKFTCSRKAHHDGPCATYPLPPHDLVREDGRLEKLCEHGIGHTVGHIDPSKLADEYVFTHGCDGCCRTFLTQVMDALSPESEKETQESPAKGYVTVDMRRGRAFHCSIHGNSYEPCSCWEVTNELPNIIVGPAAPDVTVAGSDQIKHIVDRFLGWRLPENFNPDAGISFKPHINSATGRPYEHGPTGTNLFDATQAEEMVRYMLDGIAALPTRSEAQIRLDELDRFCGLLKDHANFYFVTSDPPVYRCRCKKDLCNGNLSNAEGRDKWIEHVRKLAGDQ